MRVIEIVASIDEQGAGPSYSVPRLSSALAAAGADVTLCTLGASGDSNGNAVRHRTFPIDFAAVPALSSLRASRALRSWLMHETEGVQVLHSHGLWLMPNVYPADAARAAHKSFILSPRGMLGSPALRFSRLKKQLFWAALQRRAAKSAALLHATSELEQDDIRAMGLRNPVAVIPNGIDVPPYERPAPGPVRTVLSLGRVHPKKGLDQLIIAWAKLGTSTKGWRLRIVGPSELGHADQLRALTAGLALSNIEIDGPAFGEAKLSEYRSADVFVLPTLHDNFAITVAEALAAGTPVIATKGAPWAGLASNRCGWWISQGPDALAAALDEAIGLSPERLTEMGVRGRDWMMRDFSWDRLGADMLEAYRWAVTGGATPKFIST
jgi:glycosyltransferase involved in cell wall biosynthesis